MALVLVVPLDQWMGHGDGSGVSLKYAVWRRQTMEVGAYLLIPVTGVTSAAVVWMLAAIGATVGLDYYARAIGLAVTTVALLMAVRQLEHVFRHYPTNASIG